MYRPCVVAVFINNKGKLLVGKRPAPPVWQFPQGGIEKTETAEVALYREMAEEIGCHQFNILLKGAQRTRYTFPKDLQSQITKKYQGQEQTWFKCEFKKNQKEDLQKALSEEFTEFKWVEPQDILDEIVFWKKDAYIKGLQMLEIIPGE